MDEPMNQYKLNFLSELVLDLIPKSQRCRNDEERFLLALKEVVRHAADLFDFQCKQKDSQHSVRSREDGNRSFMNRQHYKAVQEYTESIVYAVDLSEELALAYANRSAALFNLERFEECIRDIDRALGLKYPDRLKTKVYKRKGLCLTKLGRSGADSSFQEAIRWVEEATLNDVEKNKTRSELNKLISTPNTVSKPKKEAGKFQSPEISTTNSEIPCASDAVAIQYSEKFGRHLVATREIKPGELLISEKAFCLRLIPKNLYKYCSHCLQVCWDLIPCKNCVHAAYCSETCAQKAYDEYHEVECPIIGLFLAFKFNNVVGISVRTVIMATKKGVNLNAVKEELAHINLHADPRTKGFSEDGKFHSDQYRSVCSLVNNVDKCSPQDLTVRAFWVAIVICILAQETNIFKKKSALDTLAKNPDVVFIGGLILKLVHTVFINTYSFGASGTGPRTNEHGDALMAVSGLLNHSCDANTLRQWYGDRMAFYAAYPIKQGEQIFDNYGPRSAMMAKSERHGHLTRWHFRCDCRACRDDWPPFFLLPSYKTQPLPQESKKKLDMAMKKLRINNAAMQRGILENWPSALKQILISMELLYELTQKPCAEVALVLSMMKDYYEAADALYDYEPVGLSDVEKHRSQYYRHFQQMLSRQ